MTQSRNGSLEKSARLIVLMNLQDSGRLNGLSLQKIANLFIEPPTRQTIMRDLRDVTRLRVTLKKMKVSPAPTGQKETK
jgi:hypothetical protein